MQPLIISHVELEPFHIPFKKPFMFGGSIVTERVGFYLTLASGSVSAKGEASPLPGLSAESIRKAQHDLEEIKTLLINLKIPAERKELLKFLRENTLITSLCASARFAVESAICSLAALNAGQSLSEFLNSDLQDVSSSALLQGTYDQVMADARLLVANGVDIFKLKVGDRNIPLDVKKVNDLRSLIGEDGLLRLDGNRVWSLKEALLFIELAGIKQIEYIEEPLSDISQLGEFYNQTHIPVGLDETLSLSRCGITAPGRCSPTLAQHEAVQAYVLKPTILGGITPTLDWIEEARSTGRKAIISSCFESSVGIKILANLSLLTGHVPGLGTTRWLDTADLVNAQGFIPHQQLS